MAKRTFSILLLIHTLLLGGFSAVAWSHGGATHVLGTVTEVTQEQIIVQTKKKKIVTVTLTPTTQYKPVGKNTTGATPHVGDRVVIEATKKSGNLSAMVIRFSSVTAAPEK